MKTYPSGQFGERVSAHEFHGVDAVNYCLKQIELAHDMGEYRWEIGFVDSLLWAGCPDAETKHILQEKRRRALARLSPNEGACVTGAERVMELLSDKITRKALDAINEYLVNTLDRPYQAECDLLRGYRMQSAGMDFFDPPMPKSEVYYITEHLLPKLNEFISTTRRTEQESLFDSPISPYIDETLSRIENELPPCWANTCIIAPLLRRIRQLLVSYLDSYNKPLAYACDIIDEEWSPSENGKYKQNGFLEIGGNQPMMTNVRLSLEGRDKKWSKLIGDYFDCRYPLMSYLCCEISPTDEERKNGGGILHFRLTYLQKNYQYSRNDFKEVRFDREFRLVASKDMSSEVEPCETKDITVGSWLRSREKDKPIGSQWHETDVIGDYEIVGLIGRGGSGEVYCAQHRVLGTRVAIKFLLKDSDNARTRFVNEAKILAEEKCDGFPQFMAFGNVGEKPYLVEELLSPGEFPEEDEGVARFLMQFCPTVDYLHKRGYVHRDIKPGNILYRGERPILVDFGLVKKIGQQSVSKSQLSIIDGHVVGVGTPGYASPEQLLGNDIDITTDIHALGMMISDFFDEKLPPQWEPIVNKATNSRKQARFQSVSELLDAVRKRQENLV